MKMKNVANNFGKGLKGFGKGSTLIVRSAGFRKGSLEVLGRNVLQTVGITIGTLVLGMGMVGAIFEVQGKDLGELE